MTLLTKAKVRVEFKSAYTCYKCYNQEEGTTNLTEIEAHGLGDLIFKIEKLDGRAHGMPYYWSHDTLNGKSRYTCPKCNGSECKH